MKHMSELNVKPLSKRLRNASVAFFAYPRFERKVGFSSPFQRFNGGVLAPFLFLAFAACNGGGSSGGSSNNGGNGDDPDRQYKLVFKEYIELMEITAGRAAVLSSDETNLYFVARNSDHLGRFSRDGTGKLTFQRLWVDNADGVNGLNDAFDIIISPDDANLYVAGLGDNAVARFNLDATGDLRFSEALLDGGVTDKLGGASGLAVSSDGRHVYVTGARDDSLSFFERDATGDLTLRATFVDESGDVTDGLDGASFPTLSPDGKNLYLTGNRDHSLTVFNRDASTGALVFSAVFKDGTGDVDGLSRAFGLAVSPDGKNVYVVASEDDALSVFNRDAGMGALTFGTVLKDANKGGDLENFFGPTHVAVAPDGKSVYVTTSKNSTDALVTFDRDANTRALTFHRRITNSDLDGITVSGIQLPQDIVLSSDGQHLYVVVTDGIIHFSREAR